MDVSPFPKPGAGWSLPWADRLIQRCDGILDFLKGDFYPNSRLVTRKGRNKGITFVTAATHSASMYDEIIDVNRAGAVTVTLMEAPDIGTTHRIYDGSGAAGVNNITIDTTGATTINGGASLTIGANRGGYDLHFNGTEWKAWAL